MSVGPASTRYSCCVPITTVPPRLPHILAHRNSSRHRDELARSRQCGCFYCLAMYAPSEITTWIDDGTTALCPRCGIDSVIGDASGYPIERWLLRAMKAHWFGPAARG